MAFPSNAEARNFSQLNLLNSIPIDITATRKYTKAEKALSPVLLEGFIIGIRRGSKPYSGFELDFYGVLISGDKKNDVICAIDVVEVRQRFILT